MIRTRYVAGTAALATTLAALPFMGGAAQATDATLTVPTAVYVGDTLSLEWTPGDQDGAFNVELMKGSTRIARVASGTDAGNTQTITWVIPSGVKEIVSEGLTLKVDVGTGTDFTTNSFTVAAPTIVSWLDIDPSDPRGANDASLTSLESGISDSYYARWTSYGGTGDQVGIGYLAPGDTKPTALIKATDNDGSELIRFPVSSKIEPKAGYKIVVIPASKSATGAASPAFELIDGKLSNLGTSHPSTAKIGQTVSFQAFSDIGKFNLDLLGPDGKVAAKLATGVEEMWQGKFTFTDKMKAGDYKLQITLAEDKTATYTGGTNDKIVVSAAPALEWKTSPAIPSTVTQGESVLVKFGAADSAQVDASVTVGLKGPDGKITKLNAKDELKAGKGQFVWVVDSKLKEGKYKLVLLNNANKDDAGVLSSEIEVKANPTTLDKKIPAVATTTTVAATTTTVAATTTT